MRYGRLLNSRHSWVAPAQGTAGHMQQLPEQGDVKLVFLPTKCKTPCEKRLHTDTIPAINLWLWKRKSPAANQIALKRCHSNYKCSMEGKASLCLIQGRGLKPRAPTSPWIYCTLRSDLKSPLDGLIISPGGNQMQFMSLEKKKA